MNNIVDVKMRPLSGLKKTIVYSNESEKNFIEGALNMLSLTSKKSPSATLEDIVANALLPENEFANRVCRQLYSSELDNYEGLEKVFELFAAGPSNEARYHNGKPFVDFMYNQVAYASFPYSKTSDGYRQYFCSNFYQVYLLIAQHCTAENEDELSVIQSPVKYVKYHLDLASEEPELFVPINLLQIFRDHWDIIENFTYTYRTLASLCRLLIGCRRNFAEERLDLIELIKNASAEWN